MSKMAPAKVKMRNVFIDLVEKKGLQKITVKKITDKAGLCRSTFYLHYEDKYALMDEIQSDLLLGLGQIMLNIRKTGPMIWFDEATEKKAIETSTNYFVYVKNNARLFKILLSEKGDGKFFNRLQKFFQDWMSKTAEEWGMDCEKKFSIVISSWVYVGLINYWFETNLSLSPDELGQILLRYWRRIKTTFDSESNSVI